jgi:hypothetical protein
MRGGEEFPVRALKRDPHGSRAVTTDAESSKKGKFHEE